MGFRYISGRVVPVEDRAALDAIPRIHLPHCFGCGPRNSDGLGVSPEYTGDKVVAELAFPARFEGGPGLVHGGAVAAFFDDLLGFVPMMHQKPAVTAKLETNYLLPVLLGEVIRGEAWLTAENGRKLTAEAVGQRSDGTVCVEVSALFLQVGLEHFTQALESASEFESDEYYP